MQHLQLIITHLTKKQELAAADASYRVGTTTLEEIMKNIDICKDVAGEETLPDGIIQISTDTKTDNETKEKMTTLQNDKKKYKGQTYNCSTYAREGVRTATGQKDIQGVESTLGQSYTTPNALFNDTKNVKGTSVILDPGKKTENGFVETRM